MAGTSKPRQIAFDLAGRPARSRDDLVVSAANREAVATIDLWPDWPAPVLVIAGPDGSGKTHLAEVWREESRAVSLAANALSAANFEAAVPPLLIENCDSGGLDETGLFHLLNAARGAGSHVLLTARNAPSDWRVRLPDLASRLRNAAVIELDAPDEPLLAGVITKLFADRQTAVEPAVVQFIARRIGRSLAQAVAAVDAIDKAALEAKTRVTRPLAAAVLGQAAEGET